MLTSSSNDSDFAFKRPLDIATYVVSWLISKIYPVGLERPTRNLVVSGVTLYRKNKEVFDKLFAIQDKYGIDMCGYVSYFLHQNRNFSKDKIPMMLDTMSLHRYAEDLKISLKHQKILDNFSKSAQFMLNEVDRRNCNSVKECVKELIQENKIASLYLTGRLSAHYLAAIKNFRKIVFRMDQISRDTLSEVANQQEQLLSDLRDAFMRLKNVSVVSAIAYTERQRKSICTWF